jgi:Cutinase
MSTNENHCWWLQVRTYLQFDESKSPKYFLQPRSSSYTQRLRAGFGRGEESRRCSRMLSLMLYVNGRVESLTVWQVVFGDPFKGKAIPGINSNQIFTNCAASDPICMGLPIPLGAHLGYGSDTASMNKITEFVKKLMG